MKTVNSISGGKTSAYIAANYPADIDIFALVRIEDNDNLWMKGKDEKTRQLVSDKLGGVEFIGTAEQDEIIYTILDIEQFTGRAVDWVTGDTFEQVIKNHSDYLPNQIARFCTTDMKILPIFNHLRDKTDLPVEMRIGFRPNEVSRMETVKGRADENGLEFMKTIIGKSKTGNLNKWGEVPYRHVTFPLIDDNVRADSIHNYWKDKPVRFAYRNNCVGCVNRQPLFLSHMANKDPETFNWFIKQEKRTGNKFNSKMKYEKIKRWGVQNQLFSDDDFNECDSGYCGI
jgi:hypothetical protein